MGYKKEVEELLADWEMPENGQDAYNSFISMLNKAADKFIPSVKKYNGPIQQNKFTPKPYWNQELSRLIAERRLALAKFRKNQTPCNLDILQTKTKIAQKGIREAKTRSWQSFCENICETTSSSEMWSRMRLLKGYRTPRVAVDHETAKSLLLSLTSDYVTPPAPVFSSENSELSGPISLQELVNTIKHKDTAPGDDDISYSMIFNLPRAGKIILISLYNRYLHRGFVPWQWKKIKIVPIPKPSQNLNSVTGARPIALISCPYKIFHAIITRRLEWYFERKSCFSDEMTGFRRLRSCADNLIRLVTRIQSGFSEGMTTLGCFVDIDSAYNNVNITAMLNILGSLGIGSALRSYLWEYLNSRRFFYRN